MVVVERITINGREFTFTRSDAGFYIENEKGERYGEAYDLVEYPHVYTETDEKIPDVPDEPEET